MATQTEHKILLVSTMSLLVLATVSGVVQQRRLENQLQSNQRAFSASFLENNALRRTANLFVRQRDAEASSAGTALYIINHLPKNVRDQVKASTGGYYEVAQAQIEHNNEEVTDDAKQIDANVQQLEALAGQ